MLLVNFNVLRRVDFGLLSVLLLCSATLKFVRVVRATSLPLGSTIKIVGSALKKARPAQPQKSKFWMKGIIKSLIRLLRLFIYFIIILILKLGGLIMEKLLSILINIVLYTILTVFLGLFSLAFLLGLAEGDLSQGLFHYLQ